MNNINLLKSNKNRSTINISLTLSSKTYFDLKEYIPRGKLSSLANSLLEGYLKEERNKKLTESYKRISKSRARKDAYDSTEGVITDGIR